MTDSILSEHDIDEFKATLDAAADEHAERAVKALIADVNVNLDRFDAAHPDNPVRQWAVCLLIKKLGTKLTRSR